MIGDRVCLYEGNIALHLENHIHHVVNRRLEIALETRAKVTKVRWHPARFAALAVTVFPKHTTRKLLVTTVRSTKEFVHYLTDLLAIRQLSNRNRHDDTPVCLL